MGKFQEGWNEARAAAEAAEAEKQRRLERIATALNALSDTLSADSTALTEQQLTLKMEHGSLVLKRLMEPLAGVTFDPDARAYKIHKYAVTDGSNEDEAKDVDECAAKLGAYAYSVKT